MVVLAEQDSGKAARILEVARELVLKRGVKGVTIAEIAEKAHVAKGTVYLHWATKEDLLVGLFARDFLASLDYLADAFTADPGTALPHRLCAWLVENSLRHPFVHALQVRDADLLGVLIQHPRTTELAETVGPPAMMQVALPVWREHGCARTDWPLNEQAYALHALLGGFFAAADHCQGFPGISVASPGAVIGAAVTALLGPDRSSREGVHAIAAEALRLLHEKRDVVVASIAKLEQ